MAHEKRTGYCVAVIHLISFVSLGKHISPLTYVNRVGAMIYKFYAGYVEPSMFWYLFARSLWATTEINRAKPI